MKTIFEATKVKSKKLKNRLFRSAMWERMADDNGRVTQQLFDFYEEAAKGGVGTIITGCTYVVPGDQFYPGMMGMWDDSLVPEYRRLTDMVHGYGTRIIQQLAYGGSQGAREAGELPVWGPSAVEDLTTKTVPAPMTKDDIQFVVKAFGDAAVRAKDAGFDGVEFHGAHGYLLSQFLSGYYNRRKDEYGGSIENRARIFFEVYEEVRSRVGDEFLVLLRINSSDYVEGGATFEDCLYVCSELAKRGIDALEISGGTLSSSDYVARAKVNKPEKEGYHAEAAARIAEAVDVPVILVGGIRSPQVVENLLGTTEIEYFTLGRPLLAEPDLPNRWSRGERRKARCISCNRCPDPKPEGNVCVHREKFQAMAAKADQKRMQ